MGITDLIVDGGGNSYLKTPVGATKFRLLSIPEKFFKDFEGKRQYVTEEGAKSNPEAKIRWSSWVIDRADGVIKKWETSSGVVRDIIALANNPEYAFTETPPYDMIITRVGTTMNDTRYTITPARANTEITAVERLEIEKLVPMATVLKEDAEDKASAPLSDAPPF